MPNFPLRVVSWGLLQQYRHVTETPVAPPNVFNLAESVAKPFCALERRRFFQSRWSGRNIDSRNRPFGFDFRPFSLDPLLVGEFCNRFWRSADTASRQIISTHSAGLTPAPKIPKVCRRGNRRACRLRQSSAGRVRGFFPPPAPAWAASSGPRRASLKPASAYASARD